MEYWEEYKKLPNKLQLKTNIQFQELWNTHNPNFNKIKIFGKTCYSKRYQNCYGSTYKFSGITMPAKPIPTYLQPYMQYFSSLYNVNFNMCLLNFYEDGNHYIGMHSDNEKQLVKKTPIITITFLEDETQPRKFVIQNKKTKEKKVIMLENNCYFTMGGNHQDIFKHGIPIQKKISTKRISVTLRVFNK